MPPRNPSPEKARERPLGTDPKTQPSTESDAADAYKHVALNAVWATQRPLAAQNIFIESLLHLHKEHGAVVVLDVDPWEEFQKRVEHRSRSEDAEVSVAVKVHWFKTLTELGYLVYATTIFDSFLSDTTRFLFLTNLANMGEDCRIPIAVATKPAARAKVVNEEVAKKVRSLSYGSFDQRLEFLRTRFNLNFDVSAHTETLRKLSELRNNMVHDSSLFGFALDDSDSNNVVMKGGSSDPFQVSEGDAEKAIDAYEAVISMIYRSVRRDALGCVDKDDFRFFLR